MHYLILQLNEKTFKSLDKATQTLRFTLPFPMLAYPFYLVSLLSSCFLDISTANETED